MVIALVGSTVPIVFRWLFTSSGWVQIVPMSQLVDEGVVFDQRHDLFVVDRPKGLLALSSISPHNTRSREQILYCRSAGWFHALQHGETFDGNGVYVIGPSPRGMDGFAARIRDGIVEVDLESRVSGPPRGTPYDQPRGKFCHHNAVDGPGFWSDEAIFADAFSESF